MAMFLRGRHNSGKEMIYQLKPEARVQFVSTLFLRCASGFDAPGRFSPLPPQAGVHPVEATLPWIR